MSGPARSDESAVPTAPATERILPERMARLLHEIWALAGGLGLFHDGQRDWPWLLFLRQRRHAGKEVTLGEIGGFLGVSYPTARRIVQTLEDRGYLEVKRDGFDKRRSVVRLTAEGERQMLLYEEEVAALLQLRLRSALQHTPSSAAP